MKSKICMIIIVVALALVGASNASAGSSYMNPFNTANGTTYTCRVCHTTATGSSSARVQFGTDWARLRGSPINYSVAANNALAALDSDGDGFTNLAEVQAKTDPGDPASRPTTTTDTTPPTVGAVTVTPTSGTFTTAAPTITATLTDAQSAVTSCQYTTNGTTWVAGVVSGTASPWTCTGSPTGLMGSLAINVRGTSTGGTGTGTAVSRTVDATAPTVTFSIPSTSSSLTVSITTFTATDSTGGSGVNGYMVTETSTRPAATAAGWTASAPTSYTFTTAGVKTLYAWAKDVAGNVSTGVSAGVTITLADTTAPTVTFSIPTTATTLTVSITTFTATDNAGGTGVNGYLLTESATAPTASTSGWTASAPTSYTFATAGVKTLYAWAKDAAGNVSSGVSRSVTITLSDTTPPTVGTVTVTPTWGTFTSAAPTITATLTDGQSPVTSCQYTTNGTTWVAGVVSGTASPWTCTGSPTGLAGSLTINVRGASTGGTGTGTAVNRTVDTAAPTVTFTIPASSSSLTVPITTFTATDNAGVTGYMVSESVTAPVATAAGWTATAPASYTFATAGAKSLYAWAKDAAGNVSTSVSASVTITLPDTTAPTVTGFTVSPVAGSLRVSITSFTATDDFGVTGYLVNESAARPAAGNWPASPPNSYTFTTAGTKTLYAWARDAAGNVSNTVSQTVTVIGDSGADVESPEVMEFTLPLTSTSLTVPIVAFRAIDNVAPTAYLITTTPTAPSASDAGWRTTPPTSYTFTSGGAKTLYGWAKDAAGNVSESVWDNVDITITPPTTSYRLSVTRAGSGSGTVTSSPSGVNCGSDCSQSYAAGTRVTLAATASSGSVFSGWSGACTGTGSCVVTMSAARSVTATFNTASSGSGPNISAPASYSFGEVDPNRARTRTIAIANTGTATLRVSGIAKSGTDAAMFTVGVSSFSVAPGGTYYLSVTFRPTSEGTKSSSLAIASNDPDTRVWKINLSGEGHD